MKKAFPIGYENFKEIITKDLYYVDKTLMIKELMDKDGKVNLFTRPRRFGNTQVYNPWSMINYTERLYNDKKAFPRPYWSNTSSNSIVNELIVRADHNVKQEIEGLLAGGCIEKPIHEEITYGDIYKTQDNLWNFLLFTGYLKKQSESFRDDTLYLTMTIPNVEVKSIYRNTILEWFEQKVDNTDLSELYRSFQENDCTKIEEILTEQLIETISFYDYAESYYHGFLCGLLKTCPNFVTLSNREEGVSNR